MNLGVALRLGRVSNLPTVWSNVLAGTVLAGGAAWTAAMVLTLVGVSLLYVAGMFLNDAFDREIDAREKPTRPIPAGLVSANAVFATGFGLMLAGLALVAMAPSVAAPPTGPGPIFAGLALAGAIVFYNADHKGNALSPLFMGLCRVLAYVTAGYAVVLAPLAALFVAALVCLSYLIGLTYVAKQEAFDQLGALWPLGFLAAPVFYGVYALATGAGFATVISLAAIVAWIGVALYFLNRRAKGDVSRAVTGLIAGISLVDTLFLCAAGDVASALFAAACFVLTMGLQRWIAGD